MTSIQEFLHMGGYGLYVWGAYGTAAAVLVANVVMPMLARRDIAERVARQERLQRKAQ